MPNINFSGLIIDVPQSYVNQGGSQANQALSYLKSIGYVPDTTGHKVNFSGLILYIPLSVWNATKPNEVAAANAMIGNLLYPVPVQPQSYVDIGINPDLSSGTGTVNLGGYVNTTVTPNFGPGSTVVSTGQVTKSPSDNSDPTYNALITSIQNLDWTSISTSPIKNSPEMLIMFNILCSRKYNWNVAINNPATINAIKKLQSDSQLGVGGVGTATATLMSLGVVSAGVTSVIGAIVQGTAFFVAGFSANNASNEAQSQLASYANSQKITYNDTLSQNIYNDAMTGSWHNLNVTEGEGALISLDPPLSANPTSNEHYVQAVNIWMQAAKSVRTFYSGFTYDVYQTLLNGNSSTTTTTTTNSSTLLIIGAIAVALFILYSFVH